MKIGIEKERQHFAADIDEKRARLAKALLTNPLVQAFVVNHACTECKTVCLHVFGEETSQRERPIGKLRMSLQKLSSPQRKKVPAVFFGVGFDFAQQQFLF